MNVFLFPGQGSQIVGMGSEFYNKFDFVKKIFKKADDKLGFSLSKMILEGPSEKLQLTQNTQPAILTVSYSIFKTLINEYNFDIQNLKYIAGHSLGEYSALVSANALEFEDAIYLLHERGKAMQNAVPVGKGSMVAVLGLNIEEVKNLIKKQENQTGVCEVANDNASGQVIISGDSEAVNMMQKNLKEKKIKTMP
jgi:[acyl-carrier-protein] S-malonyltransferase